MKRLSYFLMLLVIFTACKKEEIRELPVEENTEQMSPSVASIEPINPFGWIGYPVPSNNNHQSLSGQNLIIEVNGDVYCSVGGHFLATYKLNNSTKRWETTDPTFFSSFGTGIQYFFSYQSKIYFGMNRGYEGTDNDFYSRDMTTFVNTPMADFPGTPVSDPTCFVIGSKGYIMGGHIDETGTLSNQLWEYNFSTNQWANKGNSPLGARVGAIAMVVNNKAYLGMGYSFITFNGQKIKQYKNDWIQYDPSSIFFLNRATFPGARRTNAKGFVLNGLPYVGFGKDGSNYFKDMWRYNSNDNTWTQKENLPGAAFTGSIGTFTKEGKGFLVKGSLSEFWRYYTTYEAP